MPNIQQFDTGALNLRPTEEGINTIAGNARRVGTFFQQGAGALEGLAATVRNAFGSVGRALGGGIAEAGQAAVSQINHEQISHGSAVASDGFVNLEKQWNDTVKNADPNDKSVAAKFKETVFEPWAEKFAANFTTEKSQEYADGIVNRYRQHFDTKTAADMSTMAGIAAKQNAQQTINKLSSAAYVDPSSLDTAIDVLKHSAGHIVDSSPTIDPETGARVKAELNQKGIESIVKSAVMGMIAKNPNVDLDAIQKKYGDYINGGELKMFQKQAQVQSRTDAAAVRADAINKRTQADQEMHAGSNKVINDNVSIDPQTGRPVINPNFFKQTLDLARKNPDAPSAASTVRTMLDWAESQQNKEAKAVTDPVVKTSLMDGMFSPDHPTSRIDLMKAQASGKLNDHDFTAMERMVTELEQGPLKGPIWQSTTAGVKERLIRTDIKTGDKIGADQYAGFLQDFIPKYISQSKAGTLPPNALDLNDPKSMISQSLAPYQLSMQDRLRTGAKAQPATAAKKEDVMPAVPPIGQRSVGLYETPMGPMKWTGTGWVKP